MNDNYKTTDSLAEKESECQSWIESELSAINDEQLAEFVDTDGLDKEETIEKAWSILADEFWLKF